MKVVRAAAWIVLGASAAAGAADSVRRGAFEVETLAPGVAVYRNVSAGFPGANSLVVERADGLLVVDAQPSPEAARALLAVLAKAWDKPVRYLVLSHPHVEAIGGASAFPAGTLVIASDNARTRLEDPSYDAGAECRARAADPAAWIEPKRVLPVLHVSGPLTLDDPVRRVVIYPLPQSHSRGDLLVEISGTDVVGVGGLLVGDKNPFGGDADIHGWIATLNDLIHNDRTVLVPCAGRVLAVNDVRTLRDGLAWVRGRVQQAFTDLVPRDEVVDRVMADPALGKWLDGDSKPSFARSIVEDAFNETVLDRKRRNLP